MHGASEVSLHMTPDCKIGAVQQSPQSSPPHMPHPSAQHILPVPPEERTPGKSTPHSAATYGKEKWKEKIP